MSVGMTLLGLILGHMVASFVQTYFHRRLGHGQAENWIRALHVGGHHTIYSGDALKASRYRDDEKSLTLVYLAASVLMLPVFLVFPRTFAIAFSSGLVMSYLAHIFLHAQYHLSNAIFKDHAWFRRLQALHMVHHQHQGRNFAVIDLYWDKLMGTYRGIPRHDPADAK